MSPTHACPLVLLATTSDCEQCRLRDMLDEIDPLEAQIRATRNAQHAEVRIGRHAGGCH